MTGRRGWDKLDRREATRAIAAEELEHPSERRVVLLLRLEQASYEFVDAAQEAASPYATIEQLTARHTAWLRADRKWRAAVEACRKGNR